MFNWQRKNGRRLDGPAKAEEKVEEGINIFENLEIWRTEIGKRLRIMYNDL